MLVRFMSISFFQLTCVSGGEHSTGCSLPTVQAAAPCVNGHGVLYFFHSEGGTLSREPRSREARTSEITALLKAWGDGDQAAFDRLAEHVYHELRLMARRYMKNEAQGHSMQATASGP